MTESCYDPERERFRENAIDAFVVGLKADVDRAIIEKGEGMDPEEQRRLADVLKKHAERVRNNANYDFSKMREALLKGEPIVIVVREVKNYQIENGGGWEQETDRYQVFVRIQVDVNGALVVKDIGSVVQTTVDSTTERISPQHGLARDARPVDQGLRPFVLKSAGLEEGMKLNPKGFFAITSEVDGEGTGVVVETTVGKEIYAARDGFEDEYGNRFSKTGEVERVEN